jgi:inorganic triphosphatase YgiF
MAGRNEATAFLERLRVSTEIELKLEVDPDDLPVVRQDPLLSSTESCSSHQVTVYYDTPETRLKKHGFTLRVRSVGGGFIQTVKPITDSVGLISREEIESEVASLKPDLTSLSNHPIHALLNAKGADGLEEVIRSEVNRTTWQIDRRNGRIQIDLDHGTISAGERCAEFAELEFELCDGAPASLIVAARRLSDHVPVRLGVLTKAERGFLLADNDLGKISKAAPVHVNPDMIVAEAFEVIVHACLKHYRLNEAIVIRKRKAGALHQARVAMRRLRSALTMFRPAVEDVEFQHLRHELRWFTAQLGDARNLDVFLERDLDEEERRRLIRKRERSYDHVADMMNSHKFRRLLIDLVGWTAMGAWRRGKPAQRSVRAFAARRLDRLWKSIAAAGRDLGNMDEHTRHELRIQVKKLRYAIEFLRGVYGHADGTDKRFASAVEELQESLGKLNDMTTAKSLGSSPADGNWLIGSLDERRQLIAAEDALDDLLRTGPYWHAHAELEPT